MENMKPEFPELDVPSKGDVLTSKDVVAPEIYKIKIGEPLYLLTDIAPHWAYNTIHYLEPYHIICSESFLEELAFDDLSQIKNLRVGETKEYECDYAGIYVTRL